MASVRFEQQGGYRVWYVQQVLGKPDLDGEVRYGVQVRWPTASGPHRTDPMEIIGIPALIDTAPGVWSEWLRPSDLREGTFGWHDEVHGAPRGPLVLPEHPFEMRCRLFLDDVPGRLPLARPADEAYGTTSR
jgi:hypothetical protein